MKKLNIVLIGLGILTLAGCHGGVGDSSNNTIQKSSSQNNNLNTQACTNPLSQEESAKNLQDAEFITRMGSGLDNTTKTVVSSQSCLAVIQKCEPIHISNPQAMLDFSKRSDLSALEQALNVDVSGKFGGERFSVSMAASFANSSKDNKYATNIIYLYKYAGKATFKDGVLGEGSDALTPIAKEFIAHGNTSEFQSMCGDGFVSQMDAGAVLAVRLTLNFNSHSDQQKLEAELKADMGIASIAAAIKNASSKNDVHSDLSLSAIQLGGDPQNLNDIFGKRDDKGNYPLLDCGDSTKGDTCNNMINAIIDYAQTMKGQITTNGGTIDLQKLYYSNPVSQKWDSIAVRPYIVNPSTELLKAMETLTDNYDKTKADFLFADHYLGALNGRLDTVDKLLLTSTRDKLGKQLTEVYNAPVYNTMSCYKGYVTNYCLEVKQNIDNALNQDKYKLNSKEKTILAYLKTSAYGIDLYGLVTDSKDPTVADYGTITDCFAFPISYPGEDTYALSCSGTFLKTPLDVVITNDGQLHIDGLIYDQSNKPYASNPTFRRIGFFDKSGSSELDLDEDPFGGFYTNKFNVYATPTNTMVTPKPETVIKQNFKLKVIPTDDNPA